MIKKKRKDAIQLIQFISRLVWQPNVQTLERESFVSGDSQKYFVKSVIQSSCPENFYNNYSEPPMMKAKEYYCKYPK